MTEYNLANREHHPSVINFCLDRYDTREYTKEKQTENTLFTKSYCDGFKIIISPECVATIDFMKFELAIAN